MLNETRHGADALSKDALRLKRTLTSISAVGNAS